MTTQSTTATTVPGVVPDLGVMPEGLRMALEAWIRADQICQAAYTRLKDRNYGGQALRSYDFAKGRRLEARQALRDAIPGGDTVGLYFTPDGDAVGTIEVDSSRRRVFIPSGGKVVTLD